MIPIFPREGMVEQLQATKELPLFSRLVNPDIIIPPPIHYFSLDAIAKKVKVLGGGVLSHQRDTHISLMETSSLIKRDTIFQSPFQFPLNKIMTTFWTIFQCPVRGFCDAEQNHSG